MINHRHYTYDYRRPRCNNPTYLSSSVGNSLSYFAPRPSLQAYTHAEMQHMQPTSVEHLSNSQMMKYQNMQSNPQQVQPHYEQRREHQSNDRMPANLNMPSEHSRASSRTDTYQQLENSRLSQYGSNIVNTSSNRINPFGEDEVYRRQEKRFNIITLKPREHEQVLRQYPKLTLENRDDYFYRRMEVQRKQMENSTVRDQLKQGDERMHQSQLV